ncbi:hypothetical protein [Allobranchiibius sp. GilTou38]|uniref:hypothetical protein n=1 Tax=Allobranchiibius sp. GilTou38 TaxID=2815210 RepID=UPI001AA15B94|nr:hypothetical protein [Allobranchiibius sp. GilTou38]MBO1765412.1 hypothetical protein [Allobranchiibius sp. GilTou38]
MTSPGELSRGEDRGVLGRAGDVVAPEVGAFEVGTPDVEGLPTDAEPQPASRTTPNAPSAIARVVGVVIALNRW